MDDTLDALLATLKVDGRDFELLSQWFMRSDPEYVALYKAVWLWDEWPDRWGPDKGIDLIAENTRSSLSYGTERRTTARDIGWKAGLEHVLASPIAPRFRNDCSSHQPTTSPRLRKRSCARRKSQ